MILRVDWLLTPRRFFGWGITSCYVVGAIGKGPQVWEPPSIDGLLKLFDLKLGRDFIMSGSKPSVFIIEFNFFFAF